MSPDVASRAHLYLALGAATLVASALATSAASADEGETSNHDTMSGRHRLELAVGGGLSWISDRPDGIDVAVGGQLSARAMFDLVHVRAEAWMIVPDPSRPDLFQLRGDARLLFLTVHDFTLRRGDGGELLRLFAGVGGEIDLPDDVGHLMLNTGFAMIRSGGIDAMERPFDEAYGAYVGLTARLHFWEIRDELRVAVHGMMRPPTIGLDFSVGGLLAQLEGGVTASNRLYVQALREGVVSLGPELQAQFEVLPAGPVFLWTLGVSGTLGL